MKSFFAELQRWNVYKVAVAYAVLAWLLIQVVTQVFPFFGIPNCAVRIRIGWFCRGASEIDCAAKIIAL